MLPAHAATGAERQPHGGVHRHREPDRLRPLHGVGIPRLHAEVQAPQLVPGAAQRGGRRSDVQRLVAQLVGGDQQDAHARPTLAGSGAYGSMRIRRRACAWRSEDSTAPALAARANKKPK